MSVARLRAGARVTLDRVEHLVERLCADGIWVLRNEATDRSVELSTESILRKYNAGELVFKGSQLVALRDGKPRAATTSDLPVDVATFPAAVVRLKYVRALRQMPMTQAVLEPEIRKVWEQLGKPGTKPPAWVTVYRWVSAFKDAEDNPLALVGCESNRGNREPRFDLKVIHICEDLIEEVYLTLERPTIAYLTEICRGSVIRENKKRAADGNVLPQLSLPSARLLSRMVGELPAFDVYRARHGRDAALKKFRNSTTVRVAEWILKHAEMDHTRLDLFGIDDETRIPRGRPWLTVLIDVFSRYILGICISYEPPSRATVAQCLRHALMPKTDLRERFPDIVNQWDAYGIPAGITFDGGVEFHAHELERINFELNIEPTFAPRKTPWFKGKVERFQGTLNRGISATTPGKTFENILDKEEYDPTKHAVCTISFIEFAVHKWVVDVYHQKMHRALLCSPAQAWRDSAQVTDIPMVADTLRFDAIIAGSEERVLSHKGIEYSGLLYNSHEMGELRRTYGDRLNVQIRFNRSNLGSIIVLHPERGTPYRVPCLRPDYAEGLTEWQHKLCKKLAKERGMADNPDGYLEALLAIHEAVAGLKASKQKGAARDRVSRWLGGKPASDTAAIAKAAAPKQPPAAPAPPADEWEDEPVPTPKRSSGSSVKPKSFDVEIDTRFERGSFNGGE